MCRMRVGCHVHRHGGEPERVHQLDDRKFESGHDCDVPASQAMVRRFVFAVNIAKYILIPASVSQRLVDSFLADVAGVTRQAWPAIGLIERDGGGQHLVEGAPRGAQEQRA